MGHVCLLGGQCTHSGLAPKKTDLARLSRLASVFVLVDKKTVRNVRLKPDLTSEARCSRRGLLKTSRVFTQHQLEHVALLYRSDAHGEKILMKFDLFMLAHHLIQYPIFSECQKEQM